MNIPHDRFCVLPWISLEASPIGTVRPCCLADDELVDDAGNKFDLNTASFGAIQNSNSMRQLRQDFLDQKQPETCRKCWQEESAGRTSKRMHTLDRLKHMIPDRPWAADARPLMFLDLKLGNICNLKCRICGSWSSSTFATEELANLSAKEDRKINHHYQMLRQGAWPRENKKFWSEIDQVVDQIRYIEFTGGEPFMIQEHFDMLQGLVDRGIAHQVEIHYNTNGTQWPEQAEKIWQYFRHVEVAFSIDDVSARFEYQRSNAVWSEVCENIERFRTMRERLLNMTLQVCCTVNVFNVLYLEQVAKWIDQQDFDFVYWNMMHDAEYFSIRSLPDSSKTTIAEHLRSALVPARTQREFDNVITFMRRGISTDGSRMREEIARVDLRRGQNLCHVAPELAEIIDYAGPN
jgi:MoaA/NifB/PqqE/SkfB family radical SAM enzyme